jgi:hypothetical protein
MLRIIHSLVVAFIYANVLAPRIAIVDIPINKVLFTLILVAYFFYLINERTGIPARFVTFFLTSCAMLLSLACVSLAYGNLFEDMREFIFSLFVLTLVPVFYVLHNRIGLEHYLKHILRACTILSLYVAAMYVFFVQFQTWNPFVYIFNLNPMWGTTILYKEGGVQIAVVMSGWLSVGAVLLVGRWLQSRSFANYLGLFLFGLALFANGVIGLWLSTLVGIVILAYSHARKTMSGVLSGIGLTLIGGAVLAFWAADYLVEKSDSIVQKGMQTIQALEIFSENFAFGKGLGYKYQVSDFPSMSATATGAGSVYLESTYGMILASTGFVGAIFYSYIFLYYVARFAFVASKDAESWKIMACFATVLVAAIGNPYLWGGGLGLFFLALLAANIERYSRSRAFLPSSMSAAHG